MLIDIFTIFPQAFEGPMSAGLLGKARTAGSIQIRVHDLRDAIGRHQVDQHQVRLLLLQQILRNFGVENIALGRAIFVPAPFAELGDVDARLAKFGDEAGGREFGVQVGAACVRNDPVER